MNTTVTPGLTANALARIFHRPPERAAHGVPALAGQTRLRPGPLNAFLGLLAAAFLAVHSHAAETAAPSRPNILYCLADDWSWPHAGVYGDKVIQTPNFDRVAREGVLFTHAFCAAPSCTPSRAAMLTGQAPHRLKAGGNLHGFLPSEFPVYPDLLEAAGYVVGFHGKGWGPGDFKAGGRARNPAGPSFKNFEAFLKSVPRGKPFCFWFGSHDPHRAYVKDSGVNSGLKPGDVTVPPYLPDAPEVRKDILDYYFAAQRFDRDVGEILKLLEAAGQLDNTLIVISGDNGWPFPRCKTNLHDSGTRQPLAVRWPAAIKAGRTLDDFISLTDLAPTFLEAAGLKPLPEMTGHSFFGLTTGAEKPGTRETVFLERERHANVRAGDLSYPARAIRTKEFLYIRNLRPERWPGGDPEMWKAVGPFGDCDDSPSKQFVLAHRGDKDNARFFDLAFAKRPAEELYDLSHDPHELNNLAEQPSYAETKKKLRAQLDHWMEETKDPRVANGGDEFDHYPYFGAAAKSSTEEPQQRDLYVSGQEGYKSFRIPSLIVTTKGTLLAFCEGRKNSASDAGDIDVVLKRSLDSGATWQPMQIVVDDGPNTVGNPCPVVDRDTATIWLLLTHNLGDDKEDKIRSGTSKDTRRVWVTKSTDDGVTWSKPIDITGTTKPTNWTWYATGPGVGIQSKSGRLLIPCDYNLAMSKVRRSHVIFSDDHGANWKLAGTIGDDCNECQVVELADSTLLMNMRSYHGKNRRALSTSHDGGMTWSEPVLDDALIEPVCQASLLRYTEAKTQRKNRLLFSNPASTKRENLTVRLSYDEGKTWPVAKPLHSGPSAYSSLAVLPDRTIACLYEGGEKKASEKIILAQFSLEWLTDGSDTLGRKY